MNEQESSFAKARIGLTEFRKSFDESNTSKTTGF